MTIFYSYGNIIMGTKELGSFSLRNILIFLGFFIFSYMMSYWVFGIPRIIFIWIFFFIIIGMEIFIRYAIKFYEANKEIEKKFILLLKYFFIKDFVNILGNSIEIVQYNYMISEDKWYLKNYKGNYNDPQIYFLFTLKQENFKDLNLVWKEIFIERKNWIDTVKWYINILIMDNDSEEFAWECYKNDELEKGSAHDKRMMEFFEDYNLTEEEIIEIYKYYDDKRKELQNKIIKRIDLIKQIKIYKC
jgi:hypothetical protein